VSSRLTYRPRDAVLFGTVAGRSFRVQTAREQAGPSMWSWHEAARFGQMPHRGTAPKGPAGATLTVAENTKLEIYDWPGAYAGRFDSVDRGGRSGTGLHAHRGSLVLVKAVAGALCLHGPPPCGNPRCIVVAQGWEPLFSALKSARQVSITVEV
jgi:hypothetical protein